MEVNPSEITIRPYKASDVDDFMVYAGNDNVTRFTRWHTFTSRNEALTYMKESCIDHPFCRSICFRDRSIGYISITPQPGDGQCRAEVGYALAAKYWGHGITCKALRVAIRDVFVKFPQLVRLQALVLMDNKGSQRVLEKVGFLKEGVLRKYSWHKGDQQGLDDLPSLLISKSQPEDSSRISLRPFKLSDVHDFFSWASDDRVTKYLRWNTIASKEEALKYLQEVAIPHPWRRSICLDGKSIGNVSVKPKSGNDRHRAHVSYALAMEYWGRGIVIMAVTKSL
ncbi:hypothetical protein RJ639_001296 [Escallonia herrerae]|uniref:N-acetyltransferase domain-containing protein n=1 Tax=Escallonia herrerae TaxID=1293975 RepID=A0AA88X9N8_9ASTE|nr:hypothetical protein RJ639_001296 [Escallonia herrerae]